MGNRFQTEDDFGKHVEEEIAQLYKDKKTGELFECPLTAIDKAGQEVTFVPAGSPKGNDCEFYGKRRQTVDFTLDLKSSSARDAWEKLPSGDAKKAIAATKAKAAK